jgi:hypothetical protein
MDVYGYGAKSLLMKRSSSYVHLKISREIIDILGDSIKTKIDSYLEKQIKVTNLCITQLKAEKEFNSISILGFEVTRSNVNNLLIAILSISATAYEIFLNK